MCIHKIIMIETLHKKINITGTFSDPPCMVQKFRMPNFSKTYVFSANFGLLRVTFANSAFWVEDLFGPPRLLFTSVKVQLAHLILQCFFACTVHTAVKCKNGSTSKKSKKHFFFSNIDIFNLMTIFDLKRSTYKFAY